MTRAGSLAAEWTVLSMSAMSRRFMAALPRALRARAAMRVARGLIRGVHTLSSARTRVRRDRVRIDVRGSLFCSARERQARPLCGFCDAAAREELRRLGPVGGFYAAAALETLSRFGLPAQAHIDECRVMAAGTCVITIRFSDARVED